MTDLRDPAIRVTAMPADANVYGDIFGGWLMSMMDSAAGLTAARRSKGRAVNCEIERVGRSSMTIAVDAWRRHRHEEEAAQVTEAKFTFVAVDEHGRPRAIEG